MVGLLVILWLICGLLSWGNTLAYFQREFPNIAEWSRGTDFAFATTQLLFGPIGLLAGSLTIGFMHHGLMFWPWGRD